MNEGGERSQGSSSFLSADPAFVSPGLVGVDNGVEGLLAF
jgi:hypothetical protein